MNQRSVLRLQVYRYGLLSAGALIGMVWCGCTTVPKQTTLVTDSGLSLVVGFVYEEKVYSVGEPFSLKDCFWNSAFPVVGSAFKESRPYPDRWKAVQAKDVDVIALVENIVHGAPDRHKFSMSLRIMTRDEKTILAKSLQQEGGSLENCAEVLAGMATVLKENVETSSRMVLYANKRTVIEQPTAAPAR